MAIYLGGNLIGVAGSQAKGGSDIISFKLGQITSLSKKDMEGLTEIEPYMFYWEWKLNKIDIPETVTKIGSNAFYYTGIENLIVPESVTSINSGAFDYMINLKTLDLSKCNVATSLSPQYCYSLEYLKLSNKSTFNTSFISSNLVSLKNVEIPEDHINYFIKNNCWVSGKNSTSMILLKALDNSSIPDDENIKTINSNAFNNCITVNTITIPNSITTLPQYCFRWVKGLEILNLPNTITTYNNQCIYALEDLKELSIEANSTAITSTSFAYYFQYLPNLEKLYLNKPFTGSSNYSSYNAGFGGNTKEGVSISFGENLTSTPYAFLYWTKLSISSETLNLNKSVFSSSKGPTTSIQIRSLDIPRTKIKEITNWGNINTINNYTFSYCDYKNIVIPNNITKINSNAYQHVYNTENVYYDANVTNITSSSNYILCSSYMSPGVTFTFGSNVTSIPSYLLGTSSNSSSYKTYFKSIKFTQGSHVTELPSYFTAYNTTLTDCVIPHSITNIGANAFTGCTKLNTIYYEGTEEEYNNITNNDSSTYLANAEKIYYNNHIHDGYVVDNAGTITAIKGWRWNNDGNQDFIGDIGTWIIDSPSYKCKEGSKHAICNICNEAIIKPIDMLLDETYIYDEAYWTYEVTSGLLTNNNNQGWWLISHTLPSVSITGSSNAFSYIYNNPIKLTIHIKKTCTFSFDYKLYASVNKDTSKQHVTFKIQKNDVILDTIPCTDNDFFTQYSVVAREGDDIVLVLMSSISSSGSCPSLYLQNFKVGGLHKVNNWELLKEPTCSHVGHRQGICADCDSIVDEYYKIPHALNKGTCAICNEEVFSTNYGYQLGCSWEYDSLTNSYYLNATKTWSAQQHYDFIFDKTSSVGRFKFKISNNGDLTNKSYIEVQKFNHKDDSTLNYTILKGHVDKVYAGMEDIYEINIVPDNKIRINLVGSNSPASDSIFIISDVEFTTKKYKIEYESEGEICKTLYVDDKNELSEYTLTKRDYYFLGWSKDGVNVVDTLNTPLTDDVKYIAVWYKLDWVITTQPTCNSIGWREAMCEGNKIVEQIPKLSHNLVDGVCTMCGTTKQVQIDLTVDSKYQWYYDEDLECYRPGNGNKQNKTNSSSSFAVNITGSGTLYYDWAQSSEVSYDYLTVYKNDSKVIDYKGKGSNTANSFTYTTASIEVNDGDAIKFTYSKDSSNDSGSDEARIKNIRIE